MSHSEITENPRESANPHSKELVVIDDDRSIQKRMQFNLEETDWQLTFFSEELDALEYLASHSPEILLVDIRMPRMNGDQILERLDLVFPNFRPI